MQLARIKVPSSGAELLVDVKYIRNQFSHDQKEVTVFIAGIPMGFQLVEVLEIK